uniref:Uncharacterized protein n=1 Tax=Anguilla anguilla TaxID=7936 RepID=A0A0E9X4Q4_ANGAN
MVHLHHIFPQAMLFGHSSLFLLPQFAALLYSTFMEQSTFNCIVVMLHFLFPEEDF